MRVGDICCRNVVTAWPDEDIVEVARRMRTHHVGSVVVLEGEGAAPRPTGIMTDRDIVVSVVAELGQELGRVTVDDVVYQGVSTVSEDAPMVEALQRMRELGVRRMPVVDAEGLLVGIVTLDDLLQIQAELLGVLASLVDRGEARERELHAF